jgi:hypothetical protein
MDELDKSRHGNYYKVEKPKENNIKKLLDINLINKNDKCKCIIS